MKKVFTSVFMSFIIMFFIWVIIAWCTIPDFISNAEHYHLDLYSMFNRFNFGSQANDWFLIAFRNFIDSMKKINLENPLVKGLVNNFNSNGFNVGVAFTAVLMLFNSLLSPFMALVNSAVVLGYLVVLIIEFLGITSILATAIFDFIFTPIFVYY